MVVCQQEIYDSWIKYDNRVPKILQSTAVKSPNKKLFVVFQQQKIKWTKTKTAKKWEIFDTNIKTSPTMPILSVRIQYNSSIFRLFLFSATAILKSSHLAYTAIPFTLPFTHFVCWNSVLRKGDIEQKKTAKVVAFKIECTNILPRNISDW